MGYSQKKLQIIGGSFNLTPPADKVPIRDYLLCQNWRIDRDGQLISRYGYPLKFSIPAAGIAHSVGLTGGVEGDWYVAANYGVGPNPGSVYRSFNPAPIASGFDGNRVGFVFMNGSMFIMNQGKQGRYDAAGPNGAAGFYQWTIAAPEGSCTAAPVATPPVVASATYTYANQGVGYHHTVVIAGIEYWHNEYATDTPNYIAYQLSVYAAGDTNCTVSYATGTNGIVITPRQSLVAIAVSGSDGNAAVTLSTGTGVITNLPTGAYTLYVTFLSKDDATESNPSPVSNEVTVTGQAIALSNIPTSADTRVGARNIYVAGGTLGASSGQAYLVGSIPDNVSTTFTDSQTDDAILNAGVFMPTDNDPPPAAAGMCGPYFSRLIAWNTPSNPNRLFWTNPAVPQYWPGSANPATGNWVDVGNDGEQIIWCTMHTNVLVIYKERSIWELVGDPDTGYLQKMTDETGLVSQFALTTAGTVDYFVGPSALLRFDVDRVADVTGNIRPLFNTNIANNGPLTPPGHIVPGPNYLANALDAYYIALGAGMGKLYLGYSEQSQIPNNSSHCLLVYSLEDGRWTYHRSAVPMNPFNGFIFDGVMVCGVTGDFTANAVGYNLDDFRGFYTADVNGTGIECVYQSHYEDCGLPDNQKVWLEVVVDLTLNGDTAKVYVGADAGNVALAQVGTISTSGRQSVGFPLGTKAGALVVKPAGDNTVADGFLAKNLSVCVDVNAAHQVIIHNVYLYYYEEARLANSASTLPTDLGLGKMKQVKELELDIDATNGVVDCNVYSDLPGNALAVRQTPAVNARGRAMLRYPFAVTQGYLWRLAFTAKTGPFRLYSARLLVRPIGVYVEAYESTAGFVWDSMPLSFDSGLTKIPRMYQIALAALPIKRAREVSLDIETFGSTVRIDFLSDLPGDAMVSRFNTTFNTGTTGRRYVRIPLPDGLTSSGGPFPNGWIEGRNFQIQLSGKGTFILYEAAVELIAIGVYVEAYEAQGGAVYDSRELDMGTPAVKEATEVELDIETSGAVTVQLLSDVVASLVLPSVSTQGRQKVLLPLTVNATTQQYVEGRLLRLIVQGANAFRLYDARVKVRPFGQYLLSAEGNAGAYWDSTALDLGTQTVKQIRELQLDIWAYGQYTVTVYTDLPNNVMIAQTSYSQAATTGRTAVQIPLPQSGAPPFYLFGRLVRVTISSNSAFKLFAARIHWRPIGVYVEGYEAQAGAVWDSTPFNGGDNADKQYDQLRFEMDADGLTFVDVYTDLPGETFLFRGTFPLSTGLVQRRFFTVPLPAGQYNGTWGLEGRSIRLVVRGTSGFRLYQAQVRSAKIGRYLAQSVGDELNTLEFDFANERVKQYKGIELDMRADGNVTLQVLTSQSGSMQVEYTAPAFTTPSGRAAVRIYIGPGIRGRLLRLSLSSPSAARIFKLRVWCRDMNEANAQWEWKDYPLEESEVLPNWANLPMPETPPEFKWSDLPVPPTPPNWDWAPCPVSPTEPQWFWAKVLSVEESPDVWTWIDVPFEVNG